MTATNPNTPQGLQGVQRQDGMSWNGAGVLMQIPASNTSAYYVGDPVVTVTGIADVDGIPGCILAAGATNTPISGVLLGFRPTSALANNNGAYHRPAAAQSAATYVYVETDPNVLYAVQSNDSGGIPGAAAVGKNANLVSGTGNNYTGKSGYLLAANSVGTGIGKQVKVVGVLQTPNNDPALANCKFLVQSNQPTIFPYTAGI